MTLMGFDEVSWFISSKIRFSDSARVARSVLSDCSNSSRIDGEKNAVLNVDVESLSLDEGTGDCCLGTGMYIAVAGLLTVKFLGGGLGGC